MEHTTLAVSGMSCSHCSNRVQQALNGLRGVSNVSVDLDGGSATFDLDHSKTSIQDCISAIEDAGFKAS